MVNLLSRPVIKWAGSKRRVAAAVARLYPPCGRYFEPFVGGGSLLAARPPGVPAAAGDRYAPLVGFWQKLSTAPKAVVEAYAARHAELQAGGAAVYYRVRAEFNAAPDPDRLLFLTRTCYGGLFRTNAAGEFNVAFHHKRPGVAPAALAPVAAAWAAATAGVTFKVADYATLCPDPRPGDLFVLDPPYHWDRTAGMYGADGFDSNRFVAWLAALTSAGASWLLTIDPGSGDTVPAAVAPHRTTLADAPSAHARLRSGRHAGVSHAVLANYPFPPLRSGIPSVV